MFMGGFIVPVLQITNNRHRVCLIRQQIRQQQLPAARQMFHLGGQRGAVQRMTQIHHKRRQHNNQPWCTRPNQLYSNKLRRPGKHNRGHRQGHKRRQPGRQRQHTINQPKRNPPYGDGQFRFQTGQELLSCSWRRSYHKSIPVIQLAWLILQVSINLAIAN